MTVAGGGLRSGWALDARAALAQYSRRQWAADDGFGIGQVSSIAQTPDGYLWIGGEDGLVAFDGERFKAFRTSGESSITHVLGLSTDRQGALWIWMGGANILRYRNGTFTNVSNEIGLPDANVTALSSDAQGGILMSTIGQEIVEYNNGRVRKIGWTGIPNTLMIALAMTPDGRVWVGTRDYGLSYIENGSVISLSGKNAPKKINCLLAQGRNALWAGTDEGLFLWNGSSLQRLFGTEAFHHSPILSMVQDRDGNLWLGTPKGLFRIGKPESNRLTVEGPLLNQSITALFQDREGGLWIGTAGTLRYWKDFAFHQITHQSDGPAGLGAPVYVDGQNTVWVASSEGGLYQATETGVSKYKPDVFRNDVVYSLSGREGDVWAGRQNGGITHLRRFPGGITSETFTTADGLAQNTVFSVLEARDGTVWAGTLSAGLSRLKDGRWSTFTKADGLPSDAISAISEDSAGDLWVGTPNGLGVLPNSLSNKHWRVYDQRDGLPSDDITSILPDLDRDGGRVLWVGTARGLAVFRAGKFLSIRSDSDVLHEPIWGMTGDSSGHLWLSTPNHLARLTRSQLLDGSTDSANIRVYGHTDGVDKPGGIRRTRCIATDGSGRVWAATTGGLAATTLAYMRHPAVPTIVNIVSTVVDTGAVDLQSHRIPAPQRRIVFNYNGLNFSALERIRFRYRLDGYDKDWSDPVASRQAVYTHLDPGSYRFRVAASNEEGQWNSAEASVPLVIEPAVWQTRWFQFACLLAALLLSWFVYVYRMRQIAAQNSLILEERLAERMSIARDLHDTLLQSFHALMLRFQAVSNLLPSRPDAAKEMLDTTIDRAAGALTESRDAVQKLREPSVGSSDLAEVLTQFGNELREGHPDAAAMPSFRVLVEGLARPINSIVRDDLYRMGREAIGNAFRHARAGQIEVELRYESQALILRVRDDGVGIDPQLLARGSRDGHWGLPGMRERTIGLGGRFAVWSELRQGTEIEASIPGRRAYSVTDTA